jgi:hypothetical protein
MDLNQQNQGHSGFLEDFSPRFSSANDHSVGHIVHLHAAWAAAFSPRTRGRSCCETVLKYKSPLFIRLELWPGLW